VKCSCKFRIVHLPIADECVKRSLRPLLRIDGTQNTQFRIPERKKEMSKGLFKIKTEEKKISMHECNTKLSGLKLFNGENLSEGASCICYTQQKKILEMSSDQVEIYILGKKPRA
jgi:hypothetical protein